MAWYNGDYAGWAQYGQDITIALRTAANNPTGPTAASSTTGGSVCGVDLYAAPRVRNLVYCPATTGVNYVRIERTTTAAVYLSVTEVEVFRGGEWEDDQGWACGYKGGYE